MRPWSNGRDCRGPSRREVLRAGILSPLGLGLADWLRLRAVGAENPYGDIPDPPARARACILIWLSGGPSHLDTFDPKPDASSDVRGEFQAIETAVQGVRITEVLPELAKVLDRATLIRSLTSPEAEHERATHHLLTGYRPSPAVVYPSYGSVTARLRGFGQSTLPPYVAVPDAPSFASSGYLTPAFDPFGVGGDPNQANFRVRDLTPPDRLTLQRLRRRRSMVETLDQFAQHVPETDLTASRDSFSAQAYDLLTSGAAQEAFRLDAESPETRDRYGRTLTGQACLLARRLVEAGVAFVTVNDSGGGAAWDTHADNFPAIRDRLAPPIDRGVSALLVDLEARGLLDGTLVVVMGEFGRTPKINGNAGRDHHGRANSVLMAGGGMPRGAQIGATDENADSPIDRPVTPSDLAATLFTALGINPGRRIETPDGQPIRLVENGTPLPELL